jgi:hypothetical protein
MVEMRLSQNLVRTGETWTLRFGRPSMKGGKKSLELPLSPRVSAMLDRYLAVERLELLGSQMHDWLWVTRHGGPMNRHSASSMVRFRTKLWWGIAVGPHRFRTSLTTTQAVIDGTDPLGPSLILGHSPDISLANYNRAVALEASRRHDALISTAEDAAARMLMRPPVAWDGDESSQRRKRRRNLAGPLLPEADPFASPSPEITTRSVRNRTVSPAGKVRGDNA